MHLFLIMQQIAVANESTITTCYSDAEATFTGESITVSWTGGSLSNSSDLDAVMDKIAEHHTDSALDVSYNTAGKNAMKAAIDCIFDAEHLTISSVWLNENESEIAMRAYTIMEFNSGGSPVREYVFHSMDFASPAIFYFRRAAGSPACASTELAATAMTSSDDWFSNFGALGTTHRCGQSPDCSASCGAPKDSCPCSGTGQDCDIITNNGVTGGTGAIVRMEPL